MSEKEDAPKEIVGYRQHPENYPFPDLVLEGKENSQSLLIKK